MTQYLTIKGWEKHQHYKDRNPPWIKLYREVLDDYDMSCLQDASRLHLILIWLLSSQLNNRIPNDPEWVKNKIGAKSKVNLKELIDRGFLVLEQNASMTIANCSPETETETDNIVKQARPKKTRISLEELSIDHLAEWLAKKRAEGKYLSHDEHFILDYFKNYCKSKGATYDDYPHALRNAFEWTSCRPAQANSKYPPAGSKTDRAKQALAQAAIDGGYSSS